MATLFDDILARGRCTATNRLLGFLWRVRCGGSVTVRPSSFHPGRMYRVCQSCGDVTWTPRLKDSQGKVEANG
jgi:hypothetical protein